MLFRPFIGQQLKNLSNEIRAATHGAAHNPYQGKDKRVLFVCSMGILRSATAARLYAKRFNTRSAGTYDEALIPLTPLLLEWADEVVFVNQENYEVATGKFGEIANAKVLNIPDIYPHMNPKLKKAFKEQYGDYYGVLQISV